MARQSEEAAAVVSFALGERTYWVVASVDAYRALAASWPEGEEVVWEIGAATGAATALLAKRAAAVYAVEKAPEKLAKLRRLAAEHSNLHVIEADAVAAGPRPPIPPSLLFVDVGGDAPPVRTLNVAEAWADALKCTRVVVRNTKLHRALRSARALEGIEAWPHARAERATPPPQNPEGERVPELTVLVERLLEVTTPGVAARLVAALREAGFRERKRLQEALGRLGTAALGPLRELVEDQAAAIEARRAAGEVVRRIVREASEAAAPVGDGNSIVLQWASGRQVLSEPIDARRLLRLLASEDELARHLARNRLRRAKAPEVRAFVAALVQPTASVAEIVKALDAVGATGVLPAATVVDVALDGAGTTLQTVFERLFCCVFGLSDQKWGKELVAALKEAGSTRELAPLPHLSELFALLQRRPEAARRLLASTPFPPDLRTALMVSPHPHIRALTS